jgi:butyryl-CoA dehydrogenase
MIEAPRGYLISEEQIVLRDLVRTFSRDVILPLASKIDQESYFPSELIGPLADMGLMGALIPEEFGGANLSHVTYAMLIEELATACASTAIMVSVNNSLVASLVNSYGSQSQKEEHLTKLANGKGLGCFAISESSSGSDAAALECSYEKTDHGFVLNGTKNWITNAPVASACIVFATKDKNLKHKGISAFIHPLTLPGIEIGKPENKLGICGSKTASITYNSVELTNEMLIGDEGAGFAIAMSTLAGGRIGVAAQALGIARSAFESALKYANERKTFGKKIFEHQTIGNYFADMITRIEAARHLVLATATQKDRGENCTRSASSAKLFASETAVFVADRAVQIHGGYGYVKDFSVERNYRDAKITEIYEGTSEIQRLVIAQSLLKEYL